MEKLGSKLYSAYDKISYKALGSYVEENRKRVISDENKETVKMMYELFFGKEYENEDSKKQLKKSLK